MSIETLDKPKLSYKVASDGLFDDGAFAVKEEPVTPAEAELIEEDEPYIEQSASVSLRHYQKAASNSVVKEFREGANSTLCVMATGVGKSIVLADLSRRNEDWGHGTLIVVHRDELIRQLSRSVSRMGIHGLIEKAQERAQGGFGLLSKTVIASVQTLRDSRLQQWPKDAFSMIIVDECHRAISPSYRAIFKHFDKARVVGFTATADRQDGKNIGQVFETIAYEYNLKTAITEGFLVPLEAFPVETDPPIDLRDLRVSSDGDYSDADIDNAIQSNVGTLVNAIVKTNALEERRTIGFTAKVASAKAVAFALSDVGISADWVSGDRPDRSDVIKRHQQGEFQVLMSCDLLVEGYDDPEVSCILMLRPTKSRRIYSQAVGRGTRLFEGKKNCRIVDFAYMTGTHSLVSPVDLYDNSDTPDEVVKRAKELIEEGKERDIDNALETAKVEFEASERVKIQKRMVNARAMKYDPLAVCEILGIRNKEVYADWNNVKPATPKMVAALRKFKVDCPDDIGFGEAKKLLDTCITRAKFGKSSVKQVGLMIRLGMEQGAARNMGFQEASAWIDAKIGGRA